MNKLMNAGSEWSKPLFWLGFAQMIFGFAVALFADVPGAFVIATIGSSAAAVAALSFCLMKPLTVKIYDVLGAMLMVAYGLGTLNSWIAFAPGQGDLLQYANVSEYWLARTLGFCVASAGLLHVVGTFHSSSALFVLNPKSDIQTRLMAWICSIVLLFGLQMIATGRLGFMGNISVAEGSFQISPTAALILMLLAPAGAMAVFQGRLGKKHGVALFFYAIALVILLVQFGLGRRVFVFTLFLYALAAIIAKKPLKLLSLRNVIVVVVAGVLIQAGTTAFYAMRVASYSFKSDGSSLSIAKLVPEALRVYQERERNFLMEKIGDNVKSRTFVLEYLALIASRQDVMASMYGENTLRAALMVVPSSLYPGKFANPLFGTEESISHPHFRLPVWDAANSIYTAGIVDLGEVGLFLFPLLVCFAFSVLLVVARRVLPIAGALLISFLICNVLFAVEVDLAGYFSSLRSTLLIVGGLFLLNWIVVPRVNAPMLSSLDASR